MGRGTKRAVTLAVIALGIILIGVYAYMQSREFLRGPQVEITAPENGSVFSEAPVTIEGTAQNVATLSLNDASIFINSAGKFREKLLLLPGYNILTVSAQDRFGKRVKKTLELVYKELPKVVATSTLLRP